MKKLLSGIVIIALVCAGGFANGAEEEADTGQPLVFETRGPAGNAPTDYAQISWSAGDIAQAKEKKLRIAVLMHTSADFTNSVIAGVTDTAESIDAEIVLVADAEFDANKQKTDIENALILNPDIIVTLILDGVSGAVALRPAIDRGVKIALLSNLPSDFEHGRDYAAIVTDDLFNMGKSIAELMNEKLGGRGKVGLIFHDANYYVTNQRDRAVKTVLQRDFSGIDIVIERGVASASESEVVASAMLTQYPDLDAIYAPWDTVAEGVLAAARSSGRKDLKVFTMDLGETGALDMAREGNMSGIVADLPYELGVALTKVAVLSVLGKESPPFVTVPAIKVTRENLEESWKLSLRRDLPVEIRNALNR